MDKLISVKKKNDILQEYQGTPIGKLLQYHNLDKPFDSYDSAELLIGTCMDNRIALNLPRNFAYIIRTGGNNMLHSEFYISYALAVGKISHIAVIGHNKCGMAHVSSKSKSFIEGLVENAGWDREMAEKHFEEYAPLFEIGDEQKFVLKETKRLREQYPKIQIAPLLYVLEDHKLYIMRE